jgi:hypothetical protein
VLSPTAARKSLLWLLGTGVLGMGFEMGLAALLSPSVATLFSNVGAFLASSARRASLFLCALAQASVTAVWLRILHV